MEPTVRRLTTDLGTPTHEEWGIRKGVVLLPRLCQYPSGLFGDREARREDE